MALTFQRLTSCPVDWYFKSICPHRFPLASCIPVPEQAVLRTEKIRSPGGAFPLCRTLPWYAGLFVSHRLKLITTLTLEVGLSPNYLGRKQFTDLGKHLMVEVSALSTVL